MAKHLAGCLAPGDISLGDISIEDYLKKLAPSSTDEDREIGFGARRLRLAFYGGYFTTWMTVISWKGRVGPIHLDCYEGDPETWKQLKERIAKEYKAANPKVTEKGLQVTVGHQADPEGFREARSRILGPPLGIDPHPDLEAAYHYLWSPFSDITYGWQQGEGGDEPEGRKAIEKILAHKSGGALLDDLLRCPNPEGRLYAAEACIRLKRESARAGIDWVRNSDVKIRVSRGCEISWEPAKAPLLEMLEGH